MGITPAYAGQMHFLLLVKVGVEDHPRIRGTNLCQHSCATLPWGSPPHTRDKCIYQGGRHKGNRITPAYAGQIAFIYRYRPGVQDHPRIRGTNSFCYERVKKGGGSPPHTRDKFTLIGKSENNRRITPAYAGQMLCRSSTAILSRDHPRIRGTNSSDTLSSDFILGSPPHTRDKCIGKVESMSYIGITPAYAGQILSLLACSFALQDHPRIRGTNTKRSPKIKNPTADFGKIHSLLLPIHKSI